MTPTFNYERKLAPPPDDAPILDRFEQLLLRVAELERRLDALERPPANSGKMTHWSRC